MRVSTSRLSTLRLMCATLRRAFCLASAVLDRDFLPGNAGADVVRANLLWQLVYLFIDLRLSSFLWKTLQLYIAMRSSAAVIV